MKLYSYGNGNYTIRLDRILINSTMFEVGYGVDDEAYGGESGFRGRWSGELERRT